MASGFTVLLRQRESNYCICDSGYADEDIAVRFVKRSHATGELYYPHIFIDGTSFNDDDQFMNPAPDIDNNLTDYDILSGLEPQWHWSSVLLFNQLFNQLFRFGFLFCATFVDHFFYKPFGDIFFAKFQISFGKFQSGF